MTEQPDSALATASAAAPLPAHHLPLIPWTATWILLLSLAALLNAALIITAHGTRGFFLPLLAALVCILAALFDGATQRIPNPLTYTAILLGLALNALVPLLNLLHAQNAITWLGARGPTDSLLGLLICGGLGLLAMLAAGVHGGDLKLLAALGAMLGLFGAANITFFALAIALIYALVNLLLFGRLNTIFRIATHRALELAYLRRFHTPLPDEPATRASHIPMAIPMALGMLAAHWFNLHGGGPLL